MINKILGTLAITTAAISTMAFASPAEARGGYYGDGYYEQVRHRDGYREYRRGDYYREGRRGYRDRRAYRNQRRYYRDRRYRDRRYRGCDRGTGGTIIGAIAGGLLGNEVAGRGSRTEGTIIGGAVGALILVMIVMFFLGFFLDFIEITFVIVPLVAPPLLAMGMDPIWLGILMALNLQTSFLTPPFGFALFYLRGVAPPEVTTTALYKGVLPFIGIQIGMILLVAFVPEIATALPKMMMN